MMYFKATGDNGFISISTLDAEGNGNITQAEYEQLLQMIKDAPTGQGIVEIDGEYTYAEYPSPESDVTPEEIAEALEEIL